MPVTFRRPATSRAVALLMYAVIVPVLSVFVSAMLGALLSVVTNGTRFESLTGLLTFFVLLPLTFAWATCFAIHDYRRRAGMEIVIDAEQIVIEAGNTREAIPHAEVRAIKTSSWIVEHGYSLVLDNGQHYKIPSDVAPYVEIHTAFEKYLFPILAARIEKAIAAGETIYVPDNRIRACIQILFGLLLLGSCPIIVIIISFRGQLTEFNLLGPGTTRIRAGWYGLGGGFVVSRKGIRSRRGFREARWSQIASVKNGDCGVEITTKLGKCYSASAYAANCGAVAAWLCSKYRKISAE